MSLDALRQQRVEKLERWRALGELPYAFRYDPTHHAAELQQRGAQVTEAPGERVRVAGRITAIRGHGRAGFAHVLDGTGAIQVYFRADQLGPAFDRYALLDVGDWIGVEGALFRTRTGEITVRAEAFTLLAKSLRPLPEKWHGLTDPETRYRQRYADLFVNLAVRDTFRKRAMLVRALRAFLDARGYLEVETPVLQPIYGGAFARPFVTHHHALDMDLYLRISNELYLKRLIVGGLERVYEFSRDFRNEGIDRTHSPEFTMLEYYQAYADMFDMMTVTEGLVADAVARLQGGHVVTYQGEAIDWTPPWRRLSMVDAVSERVGEPVQSLDPRRLEALGRSHGIEARPDAGAGAWLDALFSELVQPTLRQPTLVIDHPIETSPLARASRERAGVVERFEIFVCGFELGNAFSEQIDPRAQAQALEAQGARRLSGDEEAQVMDADYIRALEYGMPPTGGVGIGIDRLVMLLTDARSIRDVLLFPQLRPEEGRPELAEDETPSAEIADAGRS